LAQSGEHQPQTTESSMKHILAASTFLFATVSSAIAGPSCQAAPDKWMKESDFKARIEAQGYQIKTFKVSKGQCYEIYGLDKAGKKVEIYFDPTTAAELERK
jgi:hypothetical protein